MTAAVSSSSTFGPTMPGTFSLSRNASMDSNALRTLLAEPLEFQETSMLGGSGLVAKEGWLEVNPPPPSAKQAVASTSALPTLPKSQRPDVSIAASGNSKALYKGPLTLGFPPTRRKVGLGFNNVGNTCYLNSVLQAVIHTPGLWTLLKSHINGPACMVKADPKNGAFCALCAMRAIGHWHFDREQQNASYTPSVITNPLRKIAKHFRIGRQEDSHEFLRFLTDAMQNAELHPFGPIAKIPAELKYTTSIHQLFGGQLRSRVTCLKCGHPSDTFDAILDISVEVRGCKSVRNAFEKFIAVDKLEGQNKYKCEKCKTLVNATKQMSVHEAPKTLVIHLKRFTPMGGKIGGEIHYEEKFDISPYMSPNQGGAKYKLYAVVCHSGGGPHSGHYTARSISTDGRWHSFDDNYVAMIGNGQRAPLGLKDAYVLFYQRDAKANLASAIAGSSSSNKVKNPFTPPTLPNVVNGVNGHSSLPAFKSSATGPSSSPEKRFVGPMLPPAPAAIGETQQPALSPKALGKRKLTDANSSEEEDSNDDDAGPPALPIRPSTVALPTVPPTATAAAAFPLYTSNRSTNGAAHHQHQKHGLHKSGKKHKKNHSRNDPYGLMTTGKGGKGGKHGRKF